MDTILESPDPFVLLIVGEPKSGKSFLTKYLVYELAVRKKINHGVIISGGNLKQYNYFDQEFVLPFEGKEQTVEILKAVEKIQKKTERPGLLILDDIVGALDVKTPEFRHLITTFRQWNLNVILITQTLNNETTTVLRSCSTALVWFRQDNMDNIRVLHKAFGIRLGKVEKLVELNNSLSKYEFILYEKEKPTDETYIICKAPSVPEFNISQ
jgi:archaellum biogenesis ATPase FlaH